jgi:hypothetical protein
VTNNFEILPGLPAHGELPLQFSSTGMGMHSEGFVVQFFPLNASSWIGNFQRGLTKLDYVLDHPNGEAVIVVAGGECYVVDLKGKQSIENFGGDFVSAIEVPNKPLIVFESFVDFERVGPKGRIWRSNRISWDGMRNIAIKGDELVGEAWSYEDIWKPFRLNLDTGKHEGGAEF